MLNYEQKLKSPQDMGVIQIEITNFCPRKCSNCTRFVGLVKKPFFMDFDTFKKSVDSLKDFNKKVPLGINGIQKVGIMGGEPTCHPKFEEFMEYYCSQIPKPHRALWTSLGSNYEKHYELIKDTFNTEIINDHIGNDSIHQPLLVALQDVVPDKNERKKLIEKCWVNRLWSASITPKGAFFCEIAAALDMVFDGPGGWAIEKNWWKRLASDKDFIEQMERWCNRCGAAIPLHRRQSSDEIDDVSETNYKEIKKLMSVGKMNYERKCELYNRGIVDDWHPFCSWYLPENGTRISKVNKIKKLEAVSVCVNYHDYLKITANLNRKFFDEWVIVTIDSDYKTKKICKLFDLKCVISDGLCSNGIFEKSKMLNDGIKVLSKTDWLLSLDVDIILPVDFKEILNTLELNYGNLYGATRKVGNNFNTSCLMNKCLDVKLLPNAIPNSPYGYFQLFSTRAKSLKNRHFIFDEKFKTASQYDGDFMSLWTFEKRKMLPINVSHISHGTQIGINWSGRKSSSILNML